VGGVILELTDGGGCWRSDTLELTDGGGCGRDDIRINRRRRVWEE